MGLINLFRKAKLAKLIAEAKKNPAKLKDVKFLTELFKTTLQVKEIREMLQGYKSYIVAILAAAVTALHALGYIDDTLFQTLMGLLGAGAVGTVAAKVNRINAEIKNGKK